jgi:hypothetical protein
MSGQMAPAALIVAGFFLFFLGVFAGGSDTLKLTLFGLGVLAMVAAGVLEVVGRRAR